MLSVSFLADSLLLGDVTVASSRQRTTAAALRIASRNHRWPARSPRRPHVVGELPQRAQYFTTDMLQHPMIVEGVVNLFVTVIRARRVMLSIRSCCAVASGGIVSANRVNKHSLTYSSHFFPSFPKDVWI